MRFFTPQRLPGGPRLLQVDPGRGVQVNFFKFTINFGFKIYHKKVFCSSRLRMEQEYRARVEAEGEKQDTSWADKIILRNELQKNKVAVEIYFFFWYIFPNSEHLQCSPSERVDPDNCHSLFSQPDLISQFDLERHFPNGISLTCEIPISAERESGRGASLTLSSGMC